MTIILKNTNHRDLKAMFCKAVASFSIAIGSLAGAQTLNAADFGMSPDADATLPLRNALEAARQQGAERLIVPAGTYHFTSNHAMQEHRAISNNDNGLKHIAVPLHGFNDFLLDAKGATFIMHGPMVAMVIERASNVTIEGLTIDWDKTFTLQATVVATDEASSSFDIEPSQANTVSIENQRIIFEQSPAPGADENGGKAFRPWKQSLSWTFFFDPETKAPAVDMPGIPQTLYGRSDRAERIGENRFRIFTPDLGLPRVGVALVAKGQLDPVRTSPAIHLYKAFDITLRDVNIHHAGGMGLIAERSGDVTLERFDVRLLPDSDRVVSTAADATHFVGCRGQITFADCHFENMLDDATNVHSVYLRVEKLTGPRSFLAKLMHYQQYGFTAVEAGDRIRFTSRRTLDEYADATASSVRVLNERYVEITIDRDLDGWFQPDSVIDNLSWQPSIRMTGCTIRRNRARSILISTAGDVVIENNLFDRSSMMNILIEGDAITWHEAGPVRNVRIANNRFVDLENRREMIRIAGRPQRGVTPATPYHTGITIENNKFETLSPKILFVRHAADIVFRGNTITPREGFGSVGAPAIEIINAQNVSVAQNEWGFETPPRISVDEQSASVIVTDEVAKN